MCNANNFISSVQTLGIRIRITGYSFRKALESFLHQGKRQHLFFLCANHPFQSIWSRKNFINSFSNFFRIVQNHLKREKTQKSFFPFTPRIPPGSGSGSAWRFLSGSAKKMRIRNPAWRSSRQEIDLEKALLDRIESWDVASTPKLKVRSQEKRKLR